MIDAKCMHVQDVDKAATFADRSATHRGVQSLCCVGQYWVAIAMFSVFV